MTEVSLEIILNCRIFKIFMFGICPSMIGCSIYILTYIFRNIAEYMLHELLKLNN